jgi:uncharacterized protein YeaO (DUF488 family)
MSIRLKRVYVPAEPGDGRRFLVERLWPRGVRKEAARLDAWLKDVAPSTQLRQWFSHDPARWEDFRKRYWRELDHHPEAWAPLVEAARHAQITLVYGSHDEQHNNALALKEYLDLRLGRHRGSGASHHRSTA